MEDKSEKFRERLENLMEAHERIRNVGNPFPSGQDEAVKEKTEMVKRKINLYVKAWKVGIIE